MSSTEKLPSYARTEDTLIISLSLFMLVDLLFDIKLMVKLVGLIKYV